MVIPKSIFFYIMTGFVSCGIRTTTLGTCAQVRARMENKIVFERENKKACIEYLRDLGSHQSKCHAMSDLKNLIKAMDLKYGQSHNQSARVRHQQVVEDFAILIIVRDLTTNLSQED